MKGGGGILECGPSEVLSLSGQALFYLFIFFIRGRQGPYRVLGVSTICFQKSYGSINDILERMIVKLCLCVCVGGGGHIFDYRMFTEKKKFAFQDF